MDAKEQTRIRTQLRSYLSGRMNIGLAFCDTQKHHTRISFTTVPGSKSQLLSNECKDIISNLVKEQAGDSLNIREINWSTTDGNKGWYNRISFVIPNDDGVENVVSQIDYSLAQIAPASQQLTCPYCGTQAQYSKTSNFVYRRDYGPVYFCKCKPEGVYVGCHKGTSNPLGTLADESLRALRKKVHAAFDPYWLWEAEGKKRREMRSEMYANLAKAMNIPKGECHVSHFDNSRAEYALQVISSGKLANLLPPLVRIKVEMTTRRSV
jgi:hypothetical protein